MNRLLTFTTLFQVAAIIFGVLLASAGVKFSNSYYSSDYDMPPMAVLWARWFSSYGALFLIPIVIWFGIVWSFNQDHLKIPLTEKALSVASLGITIAALIIGLMPGILMFAAMHW